MGTILKEETPQVERLARVVQELSLARDLETVMQIVRKAARKLTGADGATFVLRDADLCFYAEEDAIMPLWKGQRFPMNICISGWCMLNKKQVLIEDIFADDRIPHDAYRPTFVKSLAMVPIRTMDPIGAIGNYWAHNHVPTSEEVSILQALADITAVSLENIKVYNELEERVKQRTQELEQVNKELESFSYSVSHDLRAPLRAVNGYMAILMEDHGHEMSEDAKKIAGKIHSNAGQMALLIDDLLSFFKMGRKELSKKMIPLKLMVTDICGLLQEENKNRDIEFIIKDLPDVLADNALLKQAMLNLLSNAVKYTGHRQKAVIEVGFETTDKQTIFYVEDNGAGFDMAYAEKLFGVFQRLHSQKEFEGIGIGLAIVEKIITRHGGKVWADAKVDKGATFYFTLGS